jgi:hypothetical protein
VPITGVPSTPHEVAWMERGLAALADTHLSATERMSSILLVSTFARGEATLGVEVHAAFAAAGHTPDEAMAAYGRLLDRVVDAERFPAVRAVIDAGFFEEPETPGDPDEEFVFGLTRILDGIAVLVDRRAEAARRSATRPGRGARRARAR